MLVGCIIGPCLLQHERISVQKKRLRKLVSVFVALEGFEPSQAEPESDVLPLHHKAKCHVVLTLQRYALFLNRQIFFLYFFEKKLRSPAIKCVTHLLPETCLVYFIGYIVWCIRCHACTPDNNALRYAHIGNACLYPHLLVPQDVQMRQPS